MLEELEKSATPEQRPELDFARVTQLMRSFRKPTPEQRDRLLSAARKFQKQHPSDRRIAALLAEVATLFDSQPKVKRALLVEAQAGAGDDDLKARIADDLKRIDMLGRTVPLRFATPEGKPFQMDDLRGNVVLLIYFATWSPESITALDAVRRAAAALPQGAVRLVGVSLDVEPAPIRALLKEKGITWPVACDGKGWESPLARAAGINALPTVWLLDRHARLRSLDALAGTESQVRQLLAER